MTGKGYVLRRPSVRTSSKRRGGEGWGWGTLRTYRPWKTSEDQSSESTVGDVKDRGGRPVGLTDDTIRSLPDPVSEDVSLIPREEWTLGVRGRLRDHGAATGPFRLFPSTRPGEGPVFRPRDVCEDE